MREIKFRAWTRDGYFYDVGIDPGCMVPRCIFGGSLDPLEQYQIKNVALEQFTGLHDKNGREIYEGDIWKACRSVRSEPIEVSWIDGSSGFYPFTEPAQGGYEWESEEAERGEVIGNIHENPELVK